MTEEQAKGYKASFSWQAIEPLESLLHNHEWIDAKTLLKITDLTLDDFFQYGIRPQTPGHYALKVYEDFVISATYYYDKMLREKEKN